MANTNSAGARSDAPRELARRQGSALMAYRREPRQPIWSKADARQAAPWTIVANARENGDECLAQFGLARMPEGFESKSR